MSMRIRERRWRLWVVKTCGEAVLVLVLVLLVLELRGTASRCAMRAPRSWPQRIMGRWGGDEALLVLLLAVVLVLVEKTFDKASSSAVPTASLECVAHGVEMP